MEQALLEVNDLTISFPAKAGAPPAVDGISFSIQAGETLALVGESGSGKSLTALSLLGLLPESALVQGRIQLTRMPHAPWQLLPVQEKTFREVRGRAAAMIFQEPMTALNPVFTIGQQLGEALQRLQHLNSTETKQAALHGLAEVGLPADAAFLQRYPHQLSGGQQQRVMIALALTGNPALLIADEPTTALDVTVQRTLLERLQQIQQQRGMGLLFITHDLGLVAQLAHRVAVMYRGKIVETGLVNQVLHQPMHPYTKALLACRPEQHPPQSELPVVSTFFQPTEIAQRQPEPGSIAGQLTKPASLRVSNLSVNYGQKRVLVDVSFNLEPGETLGLVGESGSGKSTLAKALVGLVPIETGGITWGEKNRQLLGRQARARAWQMVFQDPFGSLNPRQTVAQLLEEPMRVHFPEWNAAKRRAAVNNLLTQVELPSSALHRFPAAFSGGQRQRIGIARALAVNPALLIFDESVSALDVSVQAQILNLIRQLQQSRGFSALFISHDLGVIQHISDRVLVMQQGEIVEQGNTNQVFKHPSHPYTKRLLAAVPTLQTTPQKRQPD